MEGRLLGSGAMKYGIWSKQRSSINDKTGGRGMVFFKTVVLIPAFIPKFGIIKNYKIETRVRAKVSVFTHIQPYLY